jgi:hypothetical protein
MPKMGISVDETTHHLLKKHGGERHIGALIGKMVRDFDKEDVLGFQGIYQRLDRIEHRLLTLIESQEPTKG